MFLQVCPNAGPAPPTYEDMFAKREMRVIRFFLQEKTTERRLKINPVLSVAKELSEIKISDFTSLFLSPLAGGAGLGSIHSRGRLDGRARARGARRGKAAAADQEAGYGSLHAP